MIGEGFAIYRWLMFLRNDHGVTAPETWVWEAWSIKQMWRYMNPDQL